MPYEGSRPQPKDLIPFCLPLRFGSSPLLQASAIENTSSPSPYLYVISTSTTQFPFFSPRIRLGVLDQLKKKQRSI